MNEIVPLDRPEEERYGRIICYPKYDLDELRRRLMEMRKLGIKALSFTGEKNVNNTSVLGKGYVGIVVLAYAEAGKVALKIRRTDADRAGMKHEAEMLRIANSVNIGPRLLDFTDNFLMMQFIDGLLLPKWLEALGEKEDTCLRVRNVLGKILEQAWRLDEIGLDHGELSNGSKHIIVDKEDRVFLVDFETASVTRRVSNVTSICHFLFMKGKASAMIRRRLGEIYEEALLAALRNYKKKLTRNNFERIFNIVLL